MTTGTPKVELQQLKERHTRETAELNDKLATMTKNGTPFEEVSRVSLAQNERHTRELRSFLERVSSTKDANSRER